MSTGLKEITGSQIAYIQLDDDLLRPSDLLTYSQYRDLRQDPTIHLARTLISAPIIAAKWAVQSKQDEAPDDAVEFIDRELSAIRFRFLQSAILGAMDFGWQPFEVVYNLTDEQLVGIGKIKPLLQDITEIKVLPMSGEFDGFEQELQYPSVRIPLDKSLLVAFNVEGTQWHGRPLIHNAYAPKEDWDTSNTAATRYDNKVAGAHWVIQYPVGTTVYNGVETSNDTIANSLLSQLRASSGIAIPRDLIDYQNDMGAITKENGWTIELISDSGTSSSSFVERQRYLDALKVRALGVPERAVLEGQFGTKAEAEAHGNFAIMGMELRHDEILDYLNKQVVNNLLRWNYGVEYLDSVYIVAESIDNETKYFLKQLYMELIKTPLGTEELIDRIDTNQIEDMLDIPTQELTATEQAVRDQLRQQINEEEEEQAEDEDMENETEDNAEDEDMEDDE